MLGFGLSAWGFQGFGLRVAQEGGCIKTGGKWGI